MVGYGLRELSEIFLVLLADALVTASHLSPFLLEAVEFLFLLLMLILALLSSLLILLLHPIPVPPEFLPETFSASCTKTFNLHNVTSLWNGKTKLNKTKHISCYGNILEIIIKNLNMLVNLECWQA